MLRTVASGTPPNLGPRAKGRGALGNASGRFEPHTRVAVDDGWNSGPDDRVLRTTVSEEKTRRILTYNTSPDLPFDRSINAYRGCEHGCVYCFARPTHAYLGLSPGLDFETRLVAKPGAAAALERSLSDPKYVPRPIAIGTNTDGYQPIEKTREITRDCLKVLAQYRHPVAIVTKGVLIERDIEILAPMAAQNLVRVGVSVTTLDRHLARAMEPRVPPPARKLEMIQRLTEAGIPVRIMVSPVVPALTDSELESILEAGRDAGAHTASWIMLRLPAEVAQLFSDWVRHAYPDRAERILSRLRELHGGALYQAQWHKRMRGQGAYADVIAQRFRIALRRLGLDERAPPLRCDLFRVPPKAGDQLSLF